MPWVVLLKTPLHLLNINNGSQPSFLMLKQISKWLLHRCSLNYFNSGFANAVFTAFDQRTLVLHPFVCGVYQGEHWAKLICDPLGQGVQDHYFVSYFDVSHNVFLSGMVLLYQVLGNCQVQ